MMIVDFLRAMWLAFRVVMLMGVGAMLTAVIWGAIWFILKTWLQVK